VITHRIAHLIGNRNVPSNRIVAVTFTNKAASEMRERVERLLGPLPLGGWIGTFHALCLRLLRREAERLGLPTTFNIYDTDDQLAVVKRILKQETPEDSELGTPRTFLSRISRAKNALETPSGLERRAFNPEAKLTARIYERYDEELRRNQAVDFDDLLLLPLRLFDTHPEIAQQYASRCEHLLVDEYQDTNRPQYRLIRHLASVHGNVCVVGDEDQSIYRFRGAELRNILEFERDHPGTTTIRLEQNYRSTATIIEASSSLIKRNLQRKGKTLWTENERGAKLELFRAPDDRSEATWVTQRLAGLVDGSYEDAAVLYRTNAQSRLLEDAFRRERIPYQIVGSVQFYARKEVKDLLAYLAVAANPADAVAFRRVVNTPARGIGSTTLRAVDDVAQRLQLNLVEAASAAIDEGRISSRPAKNLSGFLGLIGELARRSEKDGVAELLEFLVGTIDYDAYLEKAYAGQGAERMENVRALISGAVEFAEENDDDSLQAFLDRSALVASADEVGDRPGVTLMTIHCAKGLEFPIVFLVGLEENLFPHAMASGSDDDLEEERRLCYVAMTRAQRRLFLTHARFRRLQGALLPNPPSRFLEEVPQELIDEVSPAAGFFDNWSVSESREARGSSAARPRTKPRAPQPPPAPVTPQPDPGDGFAVGAFVKHPTFGGGQILGREGKGKHLKLTIHFSDHGSKKILPAYTQLLVRSD
jgi:DNA helicase-2/ATP-dependent DNA helicase PcrA